MLRHFWILKFISLNIFFVKFGNIKMFEYCNRLNYNTQIALIDYERLVQKYFIYCI